MTEVFSIKTYILYIFIFILSQNIYANTTIKTYELQDTYYFNEKKHIDSTSIISDIKKKFNVISIPSGVNIYKVPTHKIQKIFSKNGLSAQGVSQYITFKRKLDFDEQYIKKYIDKRYKEKYPNIEISNISIQSFSYINIKNFSIDNIELSNDKLKRDKGSIKVYFKENKIKSKNTLNKKSIFFKYHIEASLPTLKTNKNINKNQRLTSSNIARVKGSIEQYNKSIKKINLENAYAKRNIKANTLLKLSDIKKQYNIKRGSDIIVIYQVGSVTAQRNAKALQNGYLGDWINIQMQDNKKKAKIISNNRVELP